VGQRSLKVIESGTIWKFFLTFPTLTLTLILGLGVKVIRRSIDHMQLSIGPPL